MNKPVRNLLLFTLCALLGCGSVYAAPVEAETPADADEQPAATLEISSAEELLLFAENCRLDSYSAGLTVQLESDIDLSSAEMQSIPIFCGTFEGNDHTISGVNITRSGSAQGFFRYLTETAVVRDLRLQGEVAPDGSHTRVGGLAGENAGRIENCRFSGKISGSDQVGGIAGANRVSGIIEGCSVSGSLRGSHFVGGIAGENDGVIRSCSNAAGVNVTARENTVALEDISAETLSDSESAGTVTDIGGIAGGSSGVIRDCANHGNIGYQHMGYNIGGIAGRQSGYIGGCENHGRIQGRKEVGGIVGQMEPVTRVDFSTDSLQILEEQLAEMSRLADRAAANAQNSAGELRAQLAALESYAAAAANAADQLTPEIDLRDPQLPDRDSVLALQSSLSNSLSAMADTTQSITDGARGAAAGLLQDLEALGSQMGYIGGTLENAQENLGGTIADVSDQDTPEDLTGKVEDCTNDAEIAADRNVGGIVGAISVENDLDPEDDVTFSGNSSLNFAAELRCVLLCCENTGGITARRQNVGGILGLQQLGLVRECINTGALNAAGATALGGVVGSSAGYIRDCSARCAIAGGSRAGGIAGVGAVVTGCRSMVQLKNPAELQGAVLGEVQEPAADVEEPLADNLYLVVDSDRGGIDGISYDGKAQPLATETFLALEGLPEAFRHVTVRFLFADGTQQERRLIPGDSLSPADIPALPEQTGSHARWDGLAEAELDNILFDMSFSAVYTVYDTVIASEETRENGLPLLLAQGDFTTAATVSLTPATPDTTGGQPLLEKRQTVAELWQLTASEPEQLRQLRLHLPPESAAEKLRLFGWNGTTWSEIAFAVDGSYAVFSPDAAVTGLALVRTEPLPWYWFAAGAAVLILICSTVFVVLKRRKKQSAGGAAQDN